MAETFSIQEAAQRMGLSEHTLRYYERIGLLAPVSRNGSGHRRYSDPDFAWIEFLLCLKATGMGIADMKRFADLRAEGAATVAQRRELLERHQAELKARLSELGRHLTVLTAKISHYRGLERG